MGWASYLEDIEARLSDAINQARVGLDRPGSPSTDRAELRQLLTLVERARAQITGALELVTDPAFDLQFEIAELNRTRKQLEAEIQRDRLTQEQLRRAIGELRAKAESAERQVVEYEGLLWQEDHFERAVDRSGGTGRTQRYEPDPRRRA